MIKPTKLYLIRHAPVKQVKGFFPKHNPDAIIKNNQLKILATLIPNNCVWYVSPLKRAIQTAEALSKYVNYSKMVRENKLIEQNFGDWSGKKISEVWEVLKKVKQNTIFHLSHLMFLLLMEKAFQRAIQKSWNLAKKFECTRRKKYSDYFTRRYYKINIITCFKNQT